jgi:hypothetical protein
MSDWIKALVTKLKSHAGIAGYEILNEPDNGDLLNTEETTQMIVDWQLEVAKMIRPVDPNRIIFFTTRHGYAPALWLVDLSGWITDASLPQPLGFPDVAVDAHDYSGGRWGTGLVRLPGDPRDQQDLEDMYGHVLALDPSTYIGTTQGQMQWVRDKLDALDSWDIPLLVGEFGDLDTDPGVTLFFGTTTSAFAATGASWSVSRGNLGITGANLQLQPWAHIVIDAAGDYP